MGDASCALARWTTSSSKTSFYAVSNTTPLTSISLERLYYVALLHRALSPGSKQLAHVKPALGHECGQIPPISTYRKEIQTKTYE